MAKIKAVLFDLDGTLRDTGELIYKALEHGFREHNGLEFSREQMRPYIHHHREVYKGLVGEEGLDEFDDIYQAKVDELVPGAELYPDVEEVLTALRAAGYRLALVSSARRGHEFLRDRGLLDYFEVVIGANDVLRLKPDPEPVLAALEQLKLKPEAAAMIGDMIADMQASKAAGVPVRVGITHGMGTPEELRESGATQLVDKLPDLVALLKLQDKA